MQFVGDGQPWSRERTLRFIEQATEMSNRLGYCQWPLIHKADSTLIGYCGFVESDGRAEIGWRLAPAYWEQGLATEAARCALDYGFEVLGFRNVFATVQASNQPSIRVVEKLGMKLESRFERSGREVLVYSVSNPVSPVPSHNVSSE
jgi:ribosomal-protein-alanine N-acetyltransferase